MFVSLETATPEDWAKIDAPASREAELRWTCGNLLLLIEIGLGAKDTFGWPIGYAHHCLQSATRAYRANADDETIFCALFHDATEMIDAQNHGASASELIRPFVSKENYWMVRHHGVFQNFHARSHPTRFGHQREMFRSHPAFDRTMRFCADFDECSFDPNYDTMPLDAFRPMVEHFVVSRAK